MSPVAPLRPLFTCARSSLFAGLAVSALMLAGCGDDKNLFDTITTVGPSGGPGGGPSGGPSGDPTEGMPTTGGATEGVTETGSSGHGDCDQYLACLAAVSPSSVPEAEMTVGPNGSCWTTPELTETCLEQCTQGLVTLGQAFPDEPACGGGSGTTTDSTTGPVTSTTDPATSTTDPATSDPVTSDPGTSTTDPGTSTTLPDTSTTLPDTSTTDPDTTTGQGFGNCGWNGTYYICGYMGEDPNGLYPIECPANLGAAGDPCGTLTDVGCCMPNGDNPWCGNGQIVIDSCG